MILLIGHWNAISEGYGFDFYACFIHYQRPSRIVVLYIEGYGVGIHQFFVIVFSVYEMYCPFDMDVFVLGKYATREIFSVSF